MSLDLADLDLEGGTVAVVGKGKLEARRLTLNAPVREALAGWLAVHPDPRPDAPVFVRLDPAAIEPTRLTGDNVARMVRALGGAPPCRGGSGRTGSATRRSRGSSS